MKGEKERDCHRPVLERIPLDILAIRTLIFTNVPKLLLKKKPLSPYLIIVFIVHKPKEGGEEGRKREMSPPISSKVTTS